jgi:hypothetical protein
MTEIERLRAFAAEVMERSWSGGDLDGGEAQELALKYGVIVNVGFDPSQDQDEWDAGLEAGDDWFVLAWKDRARNRANCAGATKPETPSGHAADCHWQLDQYPDECTCGASARNYRNSEAKCDE